MQLPRITTRRWMVIVGGAALLLGSFVWATWELDQNTLIRRRHWYHEGYMKTYSDMANDAAGLKAESVRSGEPVEILKAEYQRRADWHAKMLEKWKEARRNHPWRSAVPDPPRPY